jgi:hypothetical protein
MIGPMDPAPLEQLRRSSGLGIDRDGRWHVRGEPVTHARILAALWKGLEVLSDGQVIVHLGDQWAYVEVADAPYVVQTLGLVGAGADARLEGVLSDGSREVLRIEELELVTGGSGYLPVKDGSVRARLSRGAYHNLLGLVVEGEAGRPELEIGARRLPIRVAVP